MPHIIMEYHGKDAVNIEKVSNTIINITNCKNVNIKDCFLCEIIIENSTVCYIEELKCCVLRLKDLQDCGLFHINKCVNTLINMVGCFSTWGLHMKNHRCCSILCNQCHFGELAIRKIKTSYVSIKNSKMRNAVAIENGVHNVEFVYENVLGMVIKEPEGVLKSMTADL